ncbi:MAG: TRAP transporter substrate-binding protein [Chromatiales bacterium]|nr:TRAP transporter substrate-binding protein [Chromatiales bacterium]
MIKKLALGAAVIAACTFTAQTWAAKTIELKLSTFLPASHPTQKDFIEPWIEELEKRTNGQVKVKIFPAGSSFGHVAKQMDQVRAGVVDIAHGLTGIPRGRLPRTAIIDMPFLVRSSEAASQTLWKLYPDYLKQEYKGVKMLALHAHNAGQIHTRTKKVESMADMKGLRMRAPSVAVSMMLEQLGASPVGMPPTQVYENLEKGVIDGTVFPWEAVYGFKLFEPLGYHLDADAYTTSFFFVMNERKYRSLPEDVRKVIDELSGQALVDQIGPLWDEWDEPGKQAIADKGNTVTKLSPEQRAEWRKALAPMIDKYLSSIEDKGVKNAREIYQKAQEYVAEFEAK